MIISLVQVSATQAVLSRRDRAAQLCYSNTRNMIHAAPMAEARGNGIMASIIRAFGW